MAYDAACGQVIVFGGGSAADTWAWDGNNWTQQFPHNAPPIRSVNAMNGSMAWLTNVLTCSLLVRCLCMSRTGRPPLTNFIGS
jgi:hypothetical protein